MPELPPKPVTDKPWAAAPDGLLITVRLTPKGGRDAIDGVERLADGSVVLKVRVRAAPHEGAANDALIQVLASTLGVRRGAVDLVAGATARLKRVRVRGDPASLIAALETLVQPQKATP
jgi:uncharacterized protein (TIGR00251 family)